MSQEVKFNLKYALWTNVSARNRKLDSHETLLFYVGGGKNNFVWKQVYINFEDPEKVIFEHRGEKSTPSILSFLS